MSAYSPSGVRCGSTGYSESRFGGSVNALDLLQWQCNSSSFENGSPFQHAVSDRSQKNHIRENIRRLRRMQATPSAKRAPYNASFIPTTQLYQVSPASQHVVDTLPPRPNTTMPRYSQPTSVEPPIPGAKTTSTDTTSAPWPVDYCGSSHEEYSSQEFSAEGLRLNKPDHVPPRFVDRPSSPIRQNSYSRESIGVQCHETRPSSDSTNSLPRHMVRLSKGVQVMPATGYSPPRGQHTDPVSVEANQALEKLGRDRIRTVSEDANQPSRSASAGPCRRGYMRAHAKTVNGEWNLKILGTLPLRRISRSPRPERLTVPKASSAKSVGSMNEYESAVQFIRRDINYVRANAHLATVKPPRAIRISSATNSRANTPQPLDDPRTSVPSRPGSGPGGDARKLMWPQRRLPVGSLPTYLVRRRQEQREAAAQAAANQPDPDQPPGHQKMPEVERRNTLDLLQK
ncbi:unnamed protein product, partial [Echinostoma caproni]|uniref:Enkurin domain-containing protein n=1 Tax=Echinostoma caproni TaxID=27848 RepID=A0A183APQ9_9TREM